MTKWIRRRAVFSALLGMAAGASLLAGSFRATASVSVAASLDELVRHSSGVAVVTPLDARAEWERGRIVTYHRLRVDSVVSGASPGSEVVVRTLGGQVGNIVQIVEGEPAFSTAERSLIFLRAQPGRALGVTARAQGQFHVDAGKQGRFSLIRRRHLGTLVGRAPRLASSEDLAAASLHGTSLETGIGRISSAWRRIHAQ